MNRCRTIPRKGFSLVELVVVMIITALSLGTLVPALNQVRGAGERVQCQNNLRQLAIGMHNINDAYKQLPPIAGPFPQNNNKSYGTLFFYLLPFIEQDNLYKASFKGGGYYVWHNRTYSVSVKTLLCPLDESASPTHLYKDWLATTSYAGNWLAFGAGGARIPNSFPDGLSNIIAFAERYQMCHDTPCAWGYPGNYYWAPMYAHYSQGKFQSRPTQLECDPALAQTPHEGGIQVAMGDGSARQVSNTISAQTWCYACTPDGGEPLGADW
jgi:prepilin-type N-terminal cleavage/methylation domain-containing protein